MIEPTDDAVRGELVPAPSQELVESDLSPAAVVERATVVSIGFVRMAAGAAGSFARRAAGAPAAEQVEEPPEEGFGVVRVIGLGLLLDSERLAVAAAERMAAFGRGMAMGMGVDRAVRDLRPPTRGPFAAWYRRGASQWSVADDRAHAVLRGSVDGAVGSAVGTIDLEQILTTVLEQVAIDQVVDTMLDRIDLNTLIEKVVGDLDLSPVIDDVLGSLDLGPVIDRVLGQLDLGPIIDKVMGELDLNPIVTGVMTEIDLNAIVNSVMDQLDMGPIIEKVLSQMDMGELTEQLGIEEIVASSTRSIASSTFDFVRGQGVSADDRVDAIVSRILRRKKAEAVQAAGAAAGVTTADNGKEDAP